MSRSRRKTPKCGNTCSGFSKGEKWDKQKANRKLRSKVRSLIKRGETPDLRLRDVSERWVMNKDGKHRFDPRENPECMRK